MATPKLSPPAHVAFYGVTMSGKTTAARQYSRAFCRARIPVVVFDPVGTSTMGGDWGDGAVIYSDAGAFQEYIHSGRLRPCKLFIDEASAIFSHEQKHNFWLAERGRHYGIQLFTITQRPMRIHPTVRDQHNEVYMFRLKSSDLAVIGADFGFDLGDIRLDSGDYIHLKSGSSRYEIGNVFKPRNPVKVIHA